jgi:hypothetical protein
MEDRNQRELQSAAVEKKESASQRTGKRKTPIETSYSEQVDRKQENSDLTEQHNPNTKQNGDETHK